MSQPVALITGASAGIGKELACLHAESGGDLVLVARREAALESLAVELREKHRIEVHVIAKDLTQPQAPGELFDEIKATGIAVEYLINNAGFGGHGLFHEREMAEDLSMIQLNITALTMLCRQFLPGMVERGSGRILNVSSTASLVPGPLQAVYFATKAYVTSLSNAIAGELEGTGVTVTALLPGATETEFASTAGLEKTAGFQNAANARSVAEVGYQAMLAGKLNVIAGMTPVQRFLMAITPIVPKRTLLKQIKGMQTISD